MEARERKTNATIVTETCRRNVLPAETNLGQQFERQNSRNKLECLAARLKQRATYLSRSSTSTSTDMGVVQDENWFKAKSTNAHGHEQINMNRATIDIADWPNQDGQKAARQRRPLQVQACTGTLRQSSNTTSQNDLHVLTLALEVKSAVGSDESSAKLTQLLESADFGQECDSCVKASHRKLQQRNVREGPMNTHTQMQMNGAKLRTNTRKAVKNATETKQHREERRPAANNS